MNNFMCTECADKCTRVVGNRVWINGEELPPCPSPGNNITNINGKVYIDGYEFSFKKNKWRRTLRAFWYRITNCF